MTKSKPKRHHWWPQLQSGHWTGSDGLLHVVRPDGTYFKTSPLNIAVEGELYTRFGPHGEKDIEIEEWFSREIEGPFAEVFPRLLLPDRIRRRPIPFKNREEERALGQLGFVVPAFVETFEMSPDERAVVNSYLAALIVRSPRYLDRVAAFHRAQGANLPGSLSREQAIKTIALENMLYLFEIYRDKIADAPLGLLFAEGDREFMFSDAGLSVSEPWRAGPIPFDVHAPLTPNASLEIIPLASASSECLIMRCRPRGVARFNRLALASAQRFVFCRGAPPSQFIQNNFGKPVPWEIRMDPATGTPRTYDKG